MGSYQDQQPQFRLVWYSNIVQLSVISIWFSKHSLHYKHNYNHNHNPNHNPNHNSNSNHNPNLDPNSNPNLLERNPNLLEGEEEAVVEEEPEVELPTIPPVEDITTSHGSYCEP